MLLYSNQYVFDNRPFARSGHMVRNKLHWDANYAVGLSKQRKVGLDWCELLCFGIPTGNLRPSVIYSVPCDRIVQRAYSLARMSHCLH